MQNKSINRFISTPEIDLIKNIVKVIKNDKLKFLNTIVKNIILYCKFCNINDINDKTHIDIKQWIDLGILGSLILIVNMIYLNMINNTFSLTFMNHIDVDGNNCLFLFKILISLTYRYNKIMSKYCSCHNFKNKIDDTLVNNIGYNLDNFIVELYNGGDINDEISKYIGGQINTFKSFNVYITDTIMGILDSSIYKSTDVLREEILKNNAALTDGLLLQLL